MCSHTVNFVWHEIAYGEEIFNGVDLSLLENTLILCDVLFWDMSMKEGKKQMKIFLFFCGCVSMCRNLIGTHKTESDSILGISWPDIRSKYEKRCHSSMLLLS